MAEESLTLRDWAACAVTFTDDPEPVAEFISTDGSFDEDTALTGAPSPSTTAGPLATTPA